MWKRDEAVKPTVPAGSGSTPAPTSVPPAAEAARTPSAPSEPQRGMERTTVNIGKSVVIKGELNGSEDLTIEGQVDGKIELRQNVLTIGPNGKIKAQVFAKRSSSWARSPATSPPARRSTSATTDRSTATSPLRAWRLPKVRISAAASTCSVRARSTSPSRRPTRRTPSPPRQRPPPASSAASSPSGAPRGARPARQLARPGKGLGPTVRSGKHVTGDDVGRVERPAWSLRSCCPESPVQHAVRPPEVGREAPEPTQAAASEVSLAERR